jgi:tetratricopeptide (TPR) repeat protein
MKTFSIVLIITMSALPQLHARQMMFAVAADRGAEGFDEYTNSNKPSDKKNDPSYKKYKEGYNLVLDERWDDALKVFAEVVKQYPKSEYVDDAEYWSAFALKHIDKKKAKAAYEKFIAAYPNSNYYDDAVADLANLGSGYTVTSVGSGVTVSESNGRGYSYGMAPTARLAQRDMRLAEQRLNLQLQHLRMPKIPRAAVAVTPPAVWNGMRVMSPGYEASDEHIDRETQLKMDALNALGETKEDSLSFKTLRDVAVDKNQPHALRETAMSTLSNFHQFDVLGVFLEIAKKDTNEEIQNEAIDYMGQLSHNKNRSMETLTDLFSAIPKYRKEQLQTVLGSIAEIGNEKAVDFLAKVAKTHDDYDLRSDAIYYLGNIGGDKARAALYEILKGK